MLTYYIIALLLHHRLICTISFYKLFKKIIFNKITAHYAMYHDLHWRLFVPRNFRLMLISICLFFIYEVLITCVPNFILYCSLRSFKKMFNIAFVVLCEIGTKTQCGTKVVPILEKYLYVIPDFCKIKPVKYKLARLKYWALLWDIEGSIENTVLRFSHSCPTLSWNIRFHSQICYSFLRFQSIEWFWKT